MVEDKEKDGAIGEEHKNGESLGMPTLSYLILLMMYTPSTRTP